ncbi:MAG: WYL domain-containing protein [Ignavibacteria bacterium]|nr:MAG: WYL domain-containing protein [Ignavibacteria bacterium]
MGSSISKPRAGPMTDQSGSDHRSSPRLDETDFLVVDVETTGLSAEGGDRVCEVGAVKLRGGAIVATLGTLIDPRRPISNGAYAVNHISPEMLRNAPVFTDVAERLWGMMENSILVAYNAPFDLSFLAAEFRLLGYPPIVHPVVDALAIARRLLPGLERYPQGHVARILGIGDPVQHRALEDAMVTAKIFTIFSSILKAYDCTAVGDLNRRDLIELLHNRRMSILTDALSSARDVWIKYLSTSSGEISDRIVSPKEFSGKARYLIAYCHTAKGERDFRIDRILDLRLMDSKSV